jgi:hypothetical protein
MDSKFTFMGRETFARVAATRAGRAGLVLLGIGVALALVGGVFFGMLLEGHPPDRSFVILRLASFGGGGLLIALVGNYLWYRAAVADRKQSPPRKSPVP